jgi:uncharacterized protein with NRDE domain
MCLIAIAFETDPAWPLIVAANRDEFHARPTDTATFWPDAPTILGGRDLTAGGSWLGVTTQGRFAAVTNVRERVDPPANARSRGLLVADFLRSGKRPEAFLAGVEAEADRYAGFNLLVSDSDALGYYSNRDASPRILDTGYYALSNATLGSSWPKVERIRDAFRDNLEKTGRPDPQGLLSLLEDRRPAPLAALPDTGIVAQRERALSAPFIVNPEFGTRASSVAAIKAGGTVEFVERAFGPRGEALETRYFSCTAS